MKLKSLSAALAITALGVATTGAFAQTAAPSTPAPSPTELVYLPQLPSVASLEAAAKAQNTAVVRIDQTSNEINVVYQYQNGTTTTVSYQVLPAGEVPPAAGTAITSSTTPPPAPGTVVYTSSAPYYYAPYPYYDGYYPWGWYAPVAIGVGIGWGWHGGWGGGWHGGGGWRR